MIKVAYLGDGVYARSDGSTVVLTTGNTYESGKADNIVYLEWETIAALEAYIKSLREAFK